MEKDEKLEHKTQISMLASKIGRLIMQDPLNMLDGSFACGVALSAILQAAKDRGLEAPEDAKMDLLASFMAGITSTTAVLASN